MLIIPKDTDILVLRVNNFQNFNFIEEHSKVLCYNNSVWMLKVGRPLAHKSIEMVKDKGGILIIKEPKKTGGTYYACHIEEIHNGMNSNKYVYPNYYAILESEGFILSGTWLNITGMLPIPETLLRNFELSNGRKKMADIVNSTQSPILYVQSLKSLTECEGQMKEGEV
jgi:hypothetical protein